MSALIEELIDWDPVGSISKIQVQSEQSYLEQKTAVQICQ